MAPLTDREYRREFTRALEGRQGIADSEDSYYVQIADDGTRGPDLRAHLLDIIDLSLGDTVTLVTGPRGSGKTSELRRLAQGVGNPGEPSDEPADRQFIFADIEDFLRPDEPIDVGRFLASVTGGLITAAGMQKSSFDSRSFWQRLADAFGRLQIRPGDMSLGLDTGPVSLETTLHVTLKDDLAFRDAVSDAIRNSRAQFRTAMHTIIGDLAEELRAGGQRPVFVVDSLDHWRGRGENYSEVRQSIERIFAEYRDELTLPGLHVIYCVPSYVQCSWANTRHMLNIKVLTRDGGLFEPGLAQLRAIVARRAPDDGGLERLFADEAQLVNVLRASGGLFRDLFRLVQEVVVNASTLPASDKAVQDAVTFCRQHLLGWPNGLNREQIDLAREVADDHAFIPRAAQQSDFDLLEALGAILRYPNGPEGHWLGVHPLLLNVVRQSPGVL